MNIIVFERAKEIQEQIKAIDLQLVLLSNNDNQNYLVNHYDKTEFNEEDGNPEDITDENKKISSYLINAELKKAIKEELFRQKTILEQEFNQL